MHKTTHQRVSGGGQAVTSPGFCVLTPYCSLMTRVESFGSVHPFWKCTLLLPLLFTSVPHETCTSLEETQVLLWMKQRAEPLKIKVWLFSLIILLSHIILKFQRSYPVHGIKPLEHYFLLILKNNKNHGIIKSFLVKPDQNAFGVKCLLGKMVFLLRSTLKIYTLPIFLDRTTSVFWFFMDICWQ